MQLNTLLEKKLRTVEKERPKRIVMGLQAELVVGPKKNFRGILANFSENGIGVIVETSPADEALNFPPGATVELNFQPRPEEIIDLHCEIRWLHVYKNPPHGLTNIIGMKIIDPPPKYKEFLDNLQYYNKIGSVHKTV